MPSTGRDHLPGQHVDVRLTADDGYQAQRSYSIASAPEDEQLVITVQRLEDGEVSPYLTETLVPGDELAGKLGVGVNKSSRKRFINVDVAEDFPGCPFFH